jgi:hypothetical protein
VSLLGLDFLAEHEDLPVQQRSLLCDTQRAPVTIRKTRSATVSSVQWWCWL